MKNAIVLYAAGEEDANLCWATHFLTPDPYAFVQIGRRKIVVVGDLELGRAQKEATVAEVRRLEDIEKILKAVGNPQPRPADVIASILVAERVERAVVPADFPVELADELRQRGFEVAPKTGVFWEARKVKSRDELRAIEEAQRAVEAAVEKAIETLRRAKIRGDRLVAGGGTLTSESLRRVIDVALMERGCVARHTIVACGDQGCDPHNAGTGPLRPNQTIIMDVFPRSSRTQYFADMTRTVVKGKASAGARRLFEAVREAQEFGIARVRPGVDGKDVHTDVQEYFKKLGFKTGMRDGHLEGYFHGTGHGVGLDIHEAPWVTRRGGRLREGCVVTVEPGLYYRGVGGVRLEDMVLVTRGGCRNLTRFPKVLEV
jgi:Xaa-Pro aminopeptidase